VDPHKGKFWGKFNTRYDSRPSQKAEPKIIWSSELTELYGKLPQLLIIVTRMDF
jgi:hypothetical protein